MWIGEVEISYIIDNRLLAGQKAEEYCRKL